MKKTLLLLALVMTSLIANAETWTPIGQVQWTEGALTGQSSSYNKTWDVSIERSDSNPKHFRLQPYANQTLGLRNDNVYIYLNCDNLDGVYIDYYKYYYKYYYKSCYYYCYYHVYQRCPENGFDSKYYGKAIDSNTIEFPIGAFAVTQKESYNQSTSSSSPSDPGAGSFSTCVHKIVFPDGILDYTPAEETYVNIGQGRWEDPIFYFTSTGNPVIKDCTVEKCVQIPDIYRIKPYDDGDYIKIYTADPSKVYISPYQHANSAGNYLYITQNCAENGQTGSYYGNLSNGKITIPSNSFIYTVSGSSDSYTGSSERNCIITLPDGFDEPLPEESGVFMGITAFNNVITNKPISLLNHESKAEFTSFIDGLTTGNATLLYYAVDQSISALKAQTYPDNLSNVVLITFTDGLDQGSLAMKPEYRNATGYANYLANCIAETDVQSLPLEAYTIGLQSDDAEDDELFNYNLQALASKGPDGEIDYHVSTVANMAELQKQLTDIYENLSRKISKRIVTISVPMMSDGDLYRYTLDNAGNDIQKSDVWFEGTFNIDNLSLENVTYHGFTVSNGNTIKTTQDGIYVNFTLMDCRTPQGELLAVNNDEIDQWTYNSSRDKWVHNIENAKAGDVNIEDITTSVALMFALDCSTSLNYSQDGDLFPVIKDTAKSFINRLAGDDAGINEILVDENDNENDNFDIYDPNVEIYNLQGLRVVNPSSGIYILRKGSRVKKILFP